MDAWLRWNPHPRPLVRRPHPNSIRLFNSPPRSWIALPLALLVFAAPFAAAAPASNPNGVAVVVGNRHYQEGIPEVIYAHRDAAAFREYLVGVRGFDPENIIDLTDARQGEMTRTFGSASNHEGQLYYFLPDRLGGTSEVVVFYSGHGVPGTDGKAYLATADADLGTAHLTAYPLAQLYTNLGKLPAKSVTVYLDACFSGGSQGGALPTSASPIYRAAELPTGVAREMTVLTAASGKELASWDENARHGMFTHHLLNALYGSGDGDGDGDVTAREAKRYLDMHLTRAVGRAYMRSQTATLIGEAGAVLASAPGGSFPRRPEVGRTEPPEQPFTVLAEPDGARVRILNIEERYQPGMELPAGEYRVEASLEGHETIVEIVRHGSEGAMQHRIALRRVEQPFIVVTDPADAHLRFLNIAERYRPGMELPAGEYRVEASLEGHETIVEIVHHGSEGATEHRIALRRVAPQWTGGERFRDCPDCPQMVVVPAGRFRMGCVSARAAPTTRSRCTRFGWMRRLRCRRTR